MLSNNEALFERAQKVMPGGVNSPVRSFQAVGGTPRFVKSAQGAFFEDANGDRYVDYIGSWGALILGHRPACVLEALQEALTCGTSFGAPTEAEIEIAEEIIKLMPSIEQIRLVSSGTEATMSALRLARGFTGRDIVIKFEGGYHGHADHLLVKAGSGLLTGGNPSSAGVPHASTQHTLVLDYNNPERIIETFKELGDQIAAVIVEPVAGNMNMVRGTPAFLNTLRSQCSQYGALLIFDEVMSGFRVALGGAQALYGITPDLTCLGKIIGAGLPLAGFGGRRDVMAHLAPLGTVYQAGTLSGNLLAVRAGLAALKHIQQPGFYAHLDALTKKVLESLTHAAQAHGIAFSTDHLGGMFGLYFSEQVPTCFTDLPKMDIAQFNRFFHLMLDERVYFAPSAYESGFVSSAHEGEALEFTARAAQRVFAALAQ